MLTCRRCGGLTPPEASNDCLHCDAPLPRPPRWARRLSALLGPTGALLLAACYGASGRYREPSPMPDGLMRVDHDHDGAAGPYECRPYATGCAERLAHAPPAEDVDCDDANASVFPGAADVDGDGVDGNCDGVDGWAAPPKAAAPVATEPAGAALPPAGAASPPATIAVPPASP